MVPGQLLRPQSFRIATKNGEYSIKRRNNIVAVISSDTVMKAIKKDKLKIEHLELHYPQKKKYKASRISIYQKFSNKFQTSSVMKFATFHIKHMWLLLLLCRI